MNTPCLKAIRFLVICVALCLSGQPLAEEGGDAELTRDLTVQGIAAQQRGDHGAALAYFERAQRELDHAKVRYFHAKSLDAVARYDQALAMFRSIESDEANQKYAFETRAYIRAIVAERETARLLAKVADLERSCAAPEPRPVKVAPLRGE
jgi:tetratricopeptide (TPR) repeat protein